MRILLVVVILFFSASFARAQESAADPRMVRVEEWLKAILHHQPGESDEAAERMGGGRLVICRRCRWTLSRCRS